MKKLYLSSYFILMSLVLAVTSTQAQVFVKHDATGNSDGTSWANAYESVDKALANIASGEIWVAAGTYLPGGATPNNNSVFALSNDIAMYGGFNGTESSLSERDPATNITILSGDLNGDDIQANFTSNKSDNTIHVISVESSLTNVIIDGFSIIGGHTSNVAGANGSGGGIYALSPVTVNQCTFRNNFGRSGGGIHLAASASGSTITNCNFSWNSGNVEGAGMAISSVDGLTVSGCTFENNTTTNGVDDNTNGGGGIFQATNSSNISMDDCTFNNNTNTVGRGGALTNFNCTNMTISNSTFSGNKAPSSGAVYYHGAGLTMNDASNFVLTSCIFNDNEATSGIGGALRNRQGSYTLDDCIFSGNTATGSGGQLRNDTNGDEVVYKNCLFEDGLSSGGWGGAHTCYGAGTYTITNCEYNNNTCANLGGAVNSGLSANSVTFDGCKFVENNSLSASGGALYVQNDGTALTVLNSYFENNSCTGNGGAIGVGGTQATNIENCEFILNTSGGFGGGVSLSEGDLDGSSLDILNSIFFVNMAANQGGAVSIVNADASIVSSLFAQNIADGSGTGGALSLNADSNIVNMSVLHCTFSENQGELAAGISQWTGEFEGFLNTTIQNNIFQQSGGLNYAVEGGTPALISNGGNMSDDESLAFALTQTNDMNLTEPTYVNPGDLDYTLTSNSPGIDAGISVGAPEFDILGNPRVNLPDIGAFENQDVTDVKEALIENNGMFTVSPNPVRGNSTKATLDNDWNGELQVRISNISGQVVSEMIIEKSVDTFQFDLPLSQVQRGVYHVSISDGEKMVVGRLIRM
jgi:hypothetical protein